MAQDASRLVAASRLSNGEGWFDLLATRRSIRVFQDRLVEREVLEKILEAIALAPMGLPPHKIEVTVVQDRETI